MDNFKGLQLFFTNTKLNMEIKFCIFFFFGSGGYPLLVVRPLKPQLIFVYVSP